MKTLRKHVLPYKEVKRIKNVYESSNRTIGVFGLTVMQIFKLIMQIGITYGIGLIRKTITDVQGWNVSALHTSKFRIIAARIRLLMYRNWNRLNMVHHQGVQSLLKTPCTTM